MSRQVVTVNVHRPRVSGVARLDESTTTLIVKLGDDVMHGGVTLFTSTQEWRRINADVEVFLAKELRKA